MTATSGQASSRWALRTVADDLVQRYVDEGWWTDDGLGDMVAHGLAALRDETFDVHSAVRPFHGTIGDLDVQARRFAGTLAERGIGRGDIVAFQLPNSAEAAITFWGAAYAGAIVVPVVHFYGAREVDYILRSTEPAILITADRFGRADYLDAYTQMLAERDTPWFVVGDTPADELPTGASSFSDLLTAEPVAEPVSVDPNEPAVIAFTSGTTSNPKGVIHSHRTLGFEVRQLTAMSPSGGPPTITGAPVGHFIGMLSAFLGSLINHRPINLVDVWDPALVLRLMLDEGLGMGGGATYFLTSLLDHPDFTDEHLKQMPYAGLGGSPVPAAITERVTKLGVKVFRSYGSTEHPSITGCSIDEPVDKRNHTDGRPLPGVEMRLDEEGQILCRGPELFLGYTDPDLTAKVFDDDGWYHTGDIGVLDDDGYLLITDRISDVIIRGGENISAQEVEELLLGLADVAEVAVVAEPDPRLGERAAAFIRALPGAETPSLDAVRAHLEAAGLARQKWPESIHPIEDFPRTPSGKVQKFVLRDRLKNASAT